MPTKKYRVVKDIRIGDGILFVGTVIELEEIESDELKEGDRFWYVDDCGRLCDSEFDNDYEDRFLQASGRLFRTKEAAEEWLEGVKKLMV